ncbi:MAG TPA: D-alanyl-D-alanine carboxypeptidase family protein [Caulobacteraceae bacterium]
MRCLPVLLLLLTLGGCASTPAAPLLWRTGLWCGGTGADHAAAEANAASLWTLPIDPFGRPEQGWAVYAPTIQRDIATRCRPERAGFAGALARWQTKQPLPPTGVFDTASLAPMKAAWQSKRPFVAIRAQGVCPLPPAETALEAAKPEETLGKAVQLRPGALKAYRRMVAAARDEIPSLAAEPDVLKLFSGYRSPAADDARCAAEGNCQGVVRAACSAHRTGLALDLDVGAAPGFMVDSSADPNRLFQSRTPAYRWLVRNAVRFGFVNYVFEPWHWEWRGEAP